MIPLVSVIVPVYNVYPYLREALNSVIGQTWYNLEILIIDDGSTDGSGEVCDEYLVDPRVKVIHQENYGLSEARNRGLELLSGEYLVFLDSDDAFDYDMIRSMMEVITRTKADCVVCDYAVVQTEGLLLKSRKGKRNTRKELSLTKKDVFVGMLEGTFAISVWNKLYKANLWQNIRFPSGCNYEDIQTIPYILDQCNQIMIYPETLVYHRKRKHSINQSNSDKNIQDLLNSYGVMERFFSKVVSPVSAELLQKRKEVNLWRLIIRFAEMKKQKVPDETTEIVRREIQYIKENIVIRKADTWIALIFYRYNYRMLLPLWRLVHYFKIRVFA